MVLDGLTTASPLVQSLVGGATFGLLFWAKVRFDPDDPAPFDVVKFSTTMLIAGAIGVGFELAGIQPTFEHYVYVFMAFGGAVGMFEAALKALIRGDRYAAQRHIEAAGQSVIRTALGLGTSSDEIKESVESGADERDENNMTDQERRDEWDGVYPEEEAYHLVDDTDDIQNETDTERNRIR